MPCGATGLCIDLREGYFFSHEEKNEVNRPKVSVPQGHGAEGVNLLTLIWRIFWNNNAACHAIRNKEARQAEQLIAVWGKNSNFALSNDTSE